MLIGQHVQIGIATPGDLGDYFCEFLLITQHVISKNRMEISEQSQAFLHGFLQDLPQKVMQRLQLKKPDHFPLDPYDLDDIYNTANFVLMCAIPGPPVGIIPTSHPSSLTFPAPAPADPTTVKIEALTAAVANLGKLVKTTSEQRAGGQSGNTVGAFMIRNLEVCDSPEPALQHNPHMLGNTYDTAYYALAYQHSAPLVSAPRDAPQVLESTPPIPSRIPTPPTLFRHLPHALQSIEPDVPATSHTSVPH